MWFIGLILNRNELAVTIILCISTRKKDGWMLYWNLACTNIMAEREFELLLPISAPTCTYHMETMLHFLIFFFLVMLICGFSSSCKRCWHCCITSSISCVLLCIDEQLTVCLLAVINTCLKGTLRVFSSGWAMLWLCPICMQSNKNGCKCRLLVGVGLRFLFACIFCTCIILCFRFVKMSISFSFRFFKSLFQ